MIVGKIEIDSQTGHHIEELRDLVAHHAAALPDMGNPINQQWDAARDAVLALQDDHPWITFERFAEICSAHGVTEVGDQRTLAGTYLHRLGRGVWYGPGAGESDADEDALLSDTVVLDAVWLSRAFVQVLEDALTRESGGMLDHRRFREIWTEHGRAGWYEYSPGEYDRIARMMRRFDVALPTRASAGERSLVPQLVPAIRPPIPWATPETAPGKRLVRLACQLDYEAEGLMARLIAATEPYHVYEGGRGLFWQAGIFLRDGSSFANEALIIVTGSERPLLSVVVSGDQPGFLMNELYVTLESVIRFWKGMTRTYYVMCPTCPPNGSYCQGRFRFETVLRRSMRESGRELDCQDFCDAEWTPEQLLYGLEAIRTDTDHQIAYLFHREKIPCPRTFLLRPADRKWHKVTSWASAVGQCLEITLVSELSGVEVASTEFSVTKAWTRVLGPVTRLASIMLTGLAIPLDGDLADQLSDGASAMEKLGELPPEDGVADGLAENGRRMRRGLPATDAELHQLHKLLQQIDLDPRVHGMEIAETRDGRWLWMTAEEAASHARPEATIGPELE